MEVKKEKCKRCNELKDILNKGICILCISASRGSPGTEIKINNQVNLHGKEIKSKSGNLKGDNNWMRK